jgi:hypothetical protein
MESLERFDICHQPDDTTCGPTCLHAVYQFYGDLTALSDIIAEVNQLEEGGTIAVYLACHALKRGYRATIIPYNLKVFDPTWSDLSTTDISSKLEQQLSYKKEHDHYIDVVTQAYLKYFELGGRLKFEVLTAALIRRYLKKSIPVITGLSSTYLYNSAREIEIDGRLIHDDVRGETTGHFVVLAGYNRQERSVLVADPLMPNPIFPRQHYRVGIYRLVCAIMLGILSYDGNLLIIEPKKKKKTYACHF